MPDKMKNYIDKYVKEKMTAMEQYLSKLPDHERIMVEDMLYDYFWYSAALNDARRHIMDEGHVIQDGSRLKENPHVSVAHKYSAKVSDFFTKIMRIFKNSLEAEEETDELIAFLKQG